MPELPDITVYVERLTAYTVGQQLESLEIRNAFIVRSVDPPIGDVVGHTVASVSRMGKRIILHFDNDLHLVIHLMIAGRLKWRVPPRRIAGKGALVAFTFGPGALYLTEAGTMRRASMHLVRGHDALAQFNRGGLEVLDIAPAAFAARLISENHTLKRALTDPRLFSGIGNAYSDEILHRARLSPLALTRRLTPEEIARLLDATRVVLTEWTDRLREEVGQKFPETVTAFHEQMAVHGRYQLPCPDCGTPVQRIRYATNETNYCARCQTNGRLLADRAMSRLLKSDWPRSIDEVD